MRNWDFPDKAKPAETPDTFGGALRLFFRQPGPLILATTVALALGIRISIGAWSWADLLVPAIMLAWWPFQEWLIHVFILHRKPNKVLGRVIDFANANKHRAHHRDPWRTELIFMPLFSMLPGIPAAALLCVLLTPTRALAATAFLTFMVLTFHYEWVHMISHTRFGLRSRLWTGQVRDHQLHHFKNENYWLGVSMTLGDKVLGTSPGAESVERSPTVRTLGVPTP